MIDWDDARRYGPEYDQWLYKLAFQKMCYAFICCDEHRSLLKDYIRSILDLQEIAGDML